jgi:hypothetical protein
MALIVVTGLTIAACGSSGTTPANDAHSASLEQAVTNTLAAPNYTEVLTENTPQGKQTDYLKYQAPDRLGGYIQNGSKRTYVYVIGSKEYQSQAVPNGTSTKQLTFHSQTSQGASALDPAHGFLPYATQAKHPTRSGDIYSFKLTTQGHTGAFTYAVNGRYVSTFTLTIPTSSVRLDISVVGTSMPIALPTGSKITPATSAPTSVPSA